MEKDKIILMIIFSWVTFISCLTETKTDKNILGFWKFEISNPARNGDEVGIFFGEIKDTTFVFWHKNVDYLPALRFWTRKDSIFTKPLSSLENVVQKPEFFGVIKYVGTDRLEILNSKEQYIFTRSTKSKFMVEVNDEWIEDNY